jgi:hypothetical protein
MMTHSAGCSEVTDYATKRHFFGASNLYTSLQYARRLQGFKICERPLILSVCGHVSYRPFDSPQTASRLTRHTPAVALQVGRWQHSTRGLATPSGQYDAVVIGGGAFCARIECSNQRTHWLLRRTWWLRGCYKGRPTRSQGVFASSLP